MCARPTSGSEAVAAAPRPARDAEAAAARAAGWRRGELLWERWQEAAHAALGAGEARRAAALWRRARWLGVAVLPRDDPRRVTGLANAAFADLLAGRSGRAARRYAACAARWRAGLAGWVAAVEPRGRARSSLFHLRLERRHRETYAEVLRRRLMAFGAETGAALEDLAAGRIPAAGFLRRWRGEKPPVFDDRRRFLAAALLLAVPGEARAPGAPRGTEPGRKEV
ncbi:MAG: tetratricopeptide repeat-containing protein [Rhodobacteraceae bacterium]|nr:tetratricopeptide repeat-containing protein [Paracoccaceae bacterium]